MPKQLEGFTVEGKPVDVRWKANLGSFPQGYALGGLYERGVGKRPRITINESMPLRAQQATLVHELLHHCVKLSGLKTTKKEEEAYCDAVDTWLAIILAENPNVVEFLTRVP